jgi:signal transduction histidine kinase
VIIWSLLKVGDKPTLHLYKQEIQDENVDVVKYLGKAGTDLNKAIKDLSGALRPNDILLTPGSMTIIPNRNGAPNN